MKTPGFLLVAACALFACEDEDGSGAVDSGVSGSIDGSADEIDAMPPVDAAPPPVDAMPSVDADTEALGDLVDAIVDDLNDVYDFMCDCDELFCADGPGNPLQIGPAEKACMENAVIAKAGTPGLETDLACAADAISDTQVCVKAAGCGGDEDEPDFIACFETEPPCLDSVHFADDFEMCLEGLF